MACSKMKALSLRPTLSQHQAQKSHLAGHSYHVPRVTCVIPETEDVKIPMTIGLKTEWKDLCMAEDFLKSLKDRPNVEIELKRLPDKDRVLTTMWPEGMKMYLNEVEVKIDSDKPIYLRKYLAPGSNPMLISIEKKEEIKAIVRAVERRPVADVLKNIKKRTFGAKDSARCIRETIPEMYEKMCKDQPRLTAVPVTLTCPREHKKIDYPAKTRYCKHVQCFDLETYLLLDLEPECWKCPVCDIQTSLDDLIIDELFHLMIADVSSNHPGVDEVVVDSSAEWRPLKDYLSVRVKDDDKNAVLSIPQPENPLFRKMVFDRKSRIETKVFDLGLGLPVVLSMRPDLDIELQCHLSKCTLDHKDNPVIITINSEKLKVDWKDHVQGRVSFHVKNILKQDDNRLEITKNENCGAHTFSMHLVHRPTVKSLLYDIMPNGFFFYHGSIPKLGKIVKISRKYKRICNFALQSLNPKANGKKGTNISLICPISKRLVLCPTRFEDCSHVEIFDLVSFLRQVGDVSKSWICPVCHIKPTVKRFHVDDFLLKILLTLKDEKARNIFVFPNGQWRLER